MILVFPKTIVWKLVLVVLGVGSYNIVDIIPSNSSITRKGLKTPHSIPSTWGSESVKKLPMSPIVRRSFQREEETESTLESSQVTSLSSFTSYDGTHTIQTTSLDTTDVRFPQESERNEVVVVDLPEIVSKRVKGGKQYRKDRFPAPNKALHNTLKERKDQIQSTILTPMFTGRRRANKGEDGISDRNVRFRQNLPMQVMRPHFSPSIYKKREGARRKQDPPLTRRTVYTAMKESPNTCLWDLY